MSKITISCTNVKCYQYGVPVKIEKEDPQYFKEGRYVCPDCGQVIEMEEKPSKTADPMLVKRILVIAGAVAGIALIVWLIIFGVRKAQEHKSEPVAEEVVEVVDETPAPTSVAAPKPASTPKLSYGKWTGKWKNGKPHGTGTMTYTTSHLIDSRDPQQRTAEKGDYIVGEFYEGALVQGVWYDKGNNQKGAIIIGRQ